MQFGIFKRKILSFCLMLLTCIPMREPLAITEKGTTSSAELNSIAGRIQKRSTLSHIKYATYKFDATSKLDIPTRRL